MKPTRRTRDLRGLNEPEKRNWRLKRDRQSYARRMEDVSYRLLRKIRLAITYDERRKSGKTSEKAGKKENAG